MELTIIIPNYNGVKFMEPCLQSLEKQTYMDFDILVVDNASADSSVEYVNTHYPDIKTISLKKNYGFSKAVNVGIKHAQTSYVILLNNDTIVDTHYVQELLTSIKSDPNIFSVSSKMIQMYHPDLIDSAGDLYTLLGWGVCRGAGRPVTNFQKDSSVFSACAGAAIYRREIFDEIGYFDEQHFAYLEDIDIGYRAKIYGYDNKYCASAKVFHVGSGTSGSKYNEFKVKLSARNNLYLNYKNQPFLQLLINFIPLAIGTFIKYLFFKKIGFAEAYRNGMNEGLHSLSHCKKVHFSFHHLLNYVKIEWELIANTFSYMKDWLTRKVLKS